MRTFVINLEDRKDRLSTFIKNNSQLKSFDRVNAINGQSLTYESLQSQGFDVNHSWKDPILESRMTKGEIGCFLSHWKVWNVCKMLNEPILILEDDALLTDKFSFDDLNECVEKGYNFVYLGWREMDKSVPIDDKFVKPVYPYWTLAYMITPESAEILTNDIIRNSIMPVDEYLPIKMPHLKVCAYTENVIVPLGRDKSGSDVHPQSRYDYFVDFDTHVCTVATDLKKANKLLTSAEKHNINLINLGEGVKWKGGSMKGQGGGHKINLIKKFISDKKDSDVLLFLDGYDTFLTDHIDEIKSRYLEISHDIVFSSERICWPDEGLGSDLKALNPDQKSPYQYLNSGMYIGRVGELKKLFAKRILNADDDQLYVQKSYLQNEDIDLVVDTDGYLFNTHEPEVRKQKGQLYNPLTKTYTCAYHGNGGKDAKENLNTLYESFYGESYITYSTTKRYDILSHDILLIDFMSADMCQKLISLASKYSFSSLSYDKVKGQELRVKEMGIYEELEKHFMSHVAPIIEEYWKPCHVYGMKDAFLIKYDQKRQNELKLHNDASLVSGSIKLNDDYEGGELYFPRQNFSNQDIPIGKCILFPSQVTHGHTSKKLLSGTKYSMTIWTQRYTGDVI